MPSSSPFDQETASGETPRYRGAGLNRLRSTADKSRSDPARERPQRLDHPRRAAAGVFVLVQPQAVVQLGRLLILRHDKRTSIDSACARRAFGARQRHDGRRQPRQSGLRVTRCTDITRTKSAALSPPRNRAAPEVGST